MKTEKIIEEVVKNTTKSDLKNMYERMVKLNKLEKWEEKKLNKQVEKWLKENKNSAWEFSVYIKPSDMYNSIIFSSEINGSRVTIYKSTINDVWVKYQFPNGKIKSLFFEAYQRVEEDEFNQQVKLIRMVEKKEKN